ncbi:hypothetical protein RJ640_011347 [Escallonia rubra]|uniref:FAF domain-containing protein n=1 Tax=Escallonia rubra TaxID=112253 RepID=A0AA88U3X8_9ASTE|nr:hypothetical protein RJ640_011347 [Escallonia rubra]
MSTVVCHGLQSCLESTQLVETTTLRLKLVAPKTLGVNRVPCTLDSDTTEYIEKSHAIHVSDNHMPTNVDSGGWDFLYSLSNTSQSPKKAMDSDTSYVHPWASQSSSLRLSEKSLGICTENLGSETGSDTSETSIFSFPSSNSDSGTSPRREREYSRPPVEPRKIQSRNFPPPLTSISSSNSLQVRPHREGGRLIIKAVESPLMHPYLQAERSHGRLRLSFLKSCEEVNEVGEIGNNSNNEENQEYDEEECEEQVDDEEEENEELVNEEEEEINGAYMGRDMTGNRFGVGQESGMGKYHRPSRCKESGHCNKGLCNWEPLWVATS